MTESYQHLREFIRGVLRHHHFYKWTLQGFGMLRTFPFPDNQEVRLHVWSKAHQVPGVSTIHNHPWDFSSTVVSGELTNVLYGVARASKTLYDKLTLEQQGGFSHERQDLRCGEGGGLIGVPTPVRLVEVGRATYTSDWTHTYMQTAEAIHESRPQDGTVTLVARKFRENRDIARVFWPAGLAWISAEPREATPAEVEAIVENALEKWRS